MFKPSRCIIKESTSDMFILTIKRHNNTYILYLDDLLHRKVKCLASFVDEKRIWHKKLSYARMRLLSKISQKELVKGLHKISFDNDSSCEFCQRDKQTKSSFHNKNVVSITWPLELLYLHLFWPTRTVSLVGKKYGIVIADELSKFI